jgi:hypothetical protein
MKSCFCPNCGNKLQVELDPPSKIVAPCFVCGRSLMVKMDRDEITIKVHGVLAAEATPLQA